jgi:hypothetical protein
MPPARAHGKPPVAVSRGRREKLNGGSPSGSLSLEPSSSNPESSRTGAGPVQAVAVGRMRLSQRRAKGEPGPPAPAASCPPQPKRELELCASAVAVVLHCARPVVADHDVRVCPNGAEPQRPARCRCARSLRRGSTRFVRGLACSREGRAPAGTARRDCGPTRPAVASPPTEVITAGGGPSPAPFPGSIAYAVISESPAGRLG